MAEHEAPNSQSKFDAATAKYTEGYEQFAKSKSGNLILDFVMFKRNIVPCTLQIIYIIGILAFWLIGIAGVVGQGPISEMTNGFFERLLYSIICVVLSPFVLHYILEICKYVFVNVAVPLWDKIVIRFFVNVMPELLPFMFERFMKFIDIVLDGIVVKIMAVATVLKGIVWLPKKLCQRLGRWCDKQSQDCEK